MIRRSAAAALFLLVGCRSAAVDGGAVIASAAANVPFEGELQTTALSASGAPMGTRTYSLKGARMRIDDDDPSPPVADVTTYIDDFDAKTIVILHRRDHDFEASTRDDSALPRRTPKIEKLETVDHVSGFECRLWRVADVEHTELCVTTGLWFRTIDPRIRVTMSSLGVADEAFEGGSFPVRARTFDAAGHVIWTVIVTHITRKSIDDSAFVIPPGYKQKTDFGFGFQ